MSEKLNYMDAIKNYKQQKKMLQDRAIKMEMSCMYMQRMIVNVAIFIVSAVSIFALIWWCGL